MSDDRFWYKDAIFYELRVRSFYDSDGDGIGDLRGLTEKLDYLQDLGVTTLWLLPFYPSPLRDDGYDIADYTDVHPDLGSLADFRLFLREAHRRGLRVVTELVLNHTSDQHPWFQRARRARPGSGPRDFYVWSDDPSRYKEARIIFSDFEHSNWTWDAVAGAYYWHRFYGHQPDLNFDNPRVRRTVRQALDFWLRMGVDGLRLDAVPYLYEREGTSCENLRETHDFLRELRAHVESRYPDRMLLAEANQWPEDAVAYLGDGDECHMAFHFPIMPRLFMGIQMEDRYPILDILEQTPQIPETCQWALFLRNHDELTLEMVTDEERDYMWRVYAREPDARINLGIRRRLAPLLDNNRRKIELMNALLLSLPGTPVLYYGDEIGMGDNVYLGDRNGVRTPMQWNPDRNAGFSTSNPQRLFLPVIVDPEYHYEAINVETQQRNPSSLLWWTKRILALRKSFRAFGRGSFEPLAPSNRRVFAFLRRYEQETLLVVANLSRFSQYVELDLSEFQARAPVELFGHIEFPPIGELPYLLTLGPHAFYWFSLQTPSPGRAVIAPEVGEPLPEIEVRGSWQDVLRGRVRARLEAVLAGYLPGRRWFRSKARNVSGTRILDSVPLDGARGETRLLLVETEYAEGEPETYVMVVGFRADIERDPAALAVLRVRERNGERRGVLCDISETPRTAERLLDFVEGRRRSRGATVELRALPGQAFRRLRGEEASLPARTLGVEQSNTSLILGDRLILKLLRRLDAGVSTDLELTRQLTERIGFTHAPQLAGHIELRRGREEPMTVALLQAFVPNEGDAWSFTRDEIARFFERMLAERVDQPEVPVDRRPLLERALEGPPAEAAEAIGGYLEQARLLGQRTGELHVALSADAEAPAFAPEPFNPFARRSFYQSLRNLGTRSFGALRQRLSSLGESEQAAGRAVLGREREIQQRFRAVMERPVRGLRIRCHGDYHLGQVLYTGRDFVMIDFEGEPARPLGERRLKRSPLVDVAGMLRSFDYAAESALSGDVEGSGLRLEDAELLRPWGRFWTAWISAAFLAAYLKAVAPARLLPEDPAELGSLLDVHVLEKAVYELGYELNNRPTWVGIPLRGILAVLDAASTGG